MTRNQIVAAMVATILTATGAIGYLRWTWSPKYSLSQLGNAYKAHDRLAFEAYLDGDAVAKSVVDDMIGGMMNDQSSAGSNDGMGALGSALAMRMADGMRPMLEAKVKESITTAVAGTNLAPGVGALQRIRSDDLVVTSRRDSLALVQVWVPREDSTPADVLTLRMIRRGRVWTIVEVEGARRFLQGVPSRDVDSRVAEAYLKSDLRNLASAEESFFADHRRYARTYEEISAPARGMPTGYFRASPGYQMEITSDDSSWTARAQNANNSISCTMSSGSGRPDDGVPMC